jgi:hypothetical protein
MVGLHSLKKQNKQNKTKTKQKTKEQIKITSQHNLFLSKTMTEIKLAYPSQKKAIKVLFCARSC